MYPPQSPTRITNISILKLAGAFHCRNTSSIRFCAFSYSIGEPCERSHQLSMYFIGQARRAGVGMASAMSCDLPSARRWSHSLPAVADQSPISLSAFQLSAFFFSTSQRLTSQLLGGSLLTGHFFMTGRRI